MATWPISPSWVDPATINSGNEYTNADGVTYGDMNTIIEDLINLKNSGTLPTGSVTITSNGTHDVAQYANAIVAVPTSPNLQEKAVTPTQEEQLVYADSSQGYDGLSLVTVSPVTSSIDENIVAGNIKSNVTILGVRGTYAGGISLQEKIADPSTTQQIVEPDSGYGGLSKVIVNYIHTETPTVTPTTSTQVVTPLTQGFYLSQVTVNGVTSSIDSNIQAANIKKDVTILGVTGTLEGSGTYQTKTVTPTASSQTVEPDSGYDALSSVTVNAVPTDTITVDATTATQTYTPPTGYFFSSFTVGAIQTESKTVTSTNTTQTITPTSGYYIDSITVNGIDDWDGSIT